MREDACHVLTGPYGMHVHATNIHTLTCPPLHVRTCAHTHTRVLAVTCAQILALSLPSCKTSFLRHKRWLQVVGTI